MKIAIDRDKEVNKLKEMLDTLTDKKDLQSVRFAINILENIDGTPLPKGYGRLIDADSIISEINKRIEKCREEHGCYGNSYDARCFNLYNIVIDIINNAQIANIERGDEDV